MKIGMTGNREGISTDALVSLLEVLKSMEIQEIHHGDCIGADKIFHDVLYEMFLDKLKIVIHPPNNNALRAYCKSNFILPPKPYLDRNKDIVDASDILIAFPSSRTEILRSGTWSTIRYARKINKKILIIYPDGQKNNN